MDNEYLRLSNQPDKKDDTVNVYSVKSEAKIVKNKKNNSTALGFIIDEFNSSVSEEVIRSELPVKKPKFLDCFTLAAVLILVLISLSVLALTFGEFFFLQPLIVLLAFIAPLSTLYFFYRLDVRSKTPVSSIIFYFLTGLIIYVIIELFYVKLVFEPFQESYSFVWVRCLIELLVTVLTAVIIAKFSKKTAISSVMMVACTVAAGFVFARSLSELTLSAMISVNILGSGSSVGALINNKVMLDLSIKTLVFSSVNTAVYDSLMFIALTVIIAEMVCSEAVKGVRKNLNSLFVFLFCGVTYALSMLNTPISFLKTIYNVTAICITAYLLYKVVNDCIKSEKYE